MPRQEREKGRSGKEGRGDTTEQGNEFASSGSQTGIKPKMIGTCIKLWRPKSKLETDIAEGHACHIGFEFLPIVHTDL